MYRQAALAECYAAVLHSSGHTATGLYALLLASVGAHAKVVFDHSLREVPNGTLSNPILEVCIDAAKGELLLVLSTCFLESIVSKSAIVTVIMLDVDAVIGCKLLECLFCFYCFI